MNRIEEIKKRKPFAVWDLLVYGILVAVILALFIGFVFVNRGGHAKGIQITLHGTPVYTYEYGKGGRAEKGYESYIEEQTENGIVLVKIYSDETRKEYNLLAIDPQKRSAVMRDANCSFRKDCTHMPAVTSDLGVIVCLPHGLKVLALGQEEDIYHPSV